MIKIAVCDDEKQVRCIFHLSSASFPEIQST